MMQGTMPGARMARKATHGLDGQQQDVDRTSGFMDDVVLGHNPRLLDVAAQLKRSAYASLGLAINCAQ